MQRIHPFCRQRIKGKKKYLIGSIASCTRLLKKKEKVWTKTNSDKYDIIVIKEELCLFTTQPYYILIYYAVLYTLKHLFLTTTKCTDSIHINAFYHLKKHLNVEKKYYFLASHNPTILQPDYTYCKAYNCWFRHYDL